MRLSLQQVFVCLVATVLHGYGHAQIQKRGVGVFTDEGGVVQAGSCLATIPNIVGPMTAVAEVVYSTFECQNNLAEGYGSIYLKIHENDGSKHKVQYVGNIKSGITTDSKGFYAVSRNGSKPVAFIGTFAGQPVMSRMLVYLNPKEDYWLYYRVVSSGERWSYGAEVVQHPSNMPKRFRMPPNVLRFASEQVLYADSINRSSSEREAGILSVIQIYRNLGWAQGMSEMMSNREITKVDWAF